MRKLRAACAEGGTAREQRMAARETLRKMVEESGECLVVIDERRKIRVASRAAAALLLKPSAQWAELQLEELFSPVARGAVAKWLERLHSPAFSPEPKADQKAEPKKLDQEKEAFPPPLDAELDRGGIVCMELRCELQGMETDGPAWLICFKDQEARQELRAAEERLEAEMAGLLDSIDSGVLLLDAEGRIRMASNRLAAIFGIESRRLLEFGTIGALMDSMSRQFLRPVDTSARWREHVRRGDEASWDEFELVGPARKIVERFARPLYKLDGTRLGWLEVYRDITGQRVIQSKLMQMEKMATLGQLVSGVAHELNNPLTSIQGYAQLLPIRRSASDRARDALHILQESERAGRIVKNLLLYSRENKSERRPVLLNEVIERTLSLRNYELKLENMDVELDLDPGLPQTLADASQLQQVVLNLIMNAEQAIVAGRGDEPRKGRILIRTRRVAGDRLAMEVSDDGPGIPPEIVPRIFDPFFTTKPPGVGTGLGLSIVYGIVQEHGGEVSVDSLKGNGATLTVQLPAMSVSGLDFAREESKPAIERRPAAVVPLPSVERVAERKHILIVEDEPTVAALIADVMAGEGYRVDMLLDSREALGRVEEKSYSLVICDLKMPYVDGTEIYRELVRRENPAQHRMLFVTGDTMGPRTLEFLKSSGLHYLAKPFLVEELKHAVRQALADVPPRAKIAPGPEWSRAAARKH
jgi:signal transduction histidine kinase/CheY-like chemotaxis protein